MMNAVDGRIGAVLVVDAPLEMAGRVAGRLTALAGTHGGATETVEHPGLAATFGTLPQALSAAAELVLDADSAKLRCGIVAVECDVELGAVLARARDLCRKTQPGQLIVSVLSTALGEPVGPSLAGREHEIEVLADALSDAEAGRPQVVTVVGELGSGRSALLAHVDDLARSRGFAVLAVVGASGALSGRWASLRGAVLRTPESGQHRVSDWLPALAADGVPHDATVARELLAQLSTLTDERPVLVSIDDVDRIDESSRAALLSLASGLAVERCLIVGSGPHAAEQHLGGAALPLAPLTDDAVRDLIERDGPINPAVLRRCVDLAGGNALAAREISRSLSPQQRSGAEPIPRVPAPAAAVLGGFRELLSQSTESARRAAVVAAADDTGDAGVVRAALVELGEDPGGLDAAEAAGLIVLEDPGLRFAHPLLRSVAYHQLAPGSRRAAHKALAVVLDRPHQAAARAYQLAAAAESPNSAASEALALVAETELSRGDVLAAARALGTAARFTGDDTVRGQRLARAATLHLRAGDLASVDVLLGDLGYPIAVPDALVARCLTDLVRTGPTRARASLERAAVAAELSAEVRALCLYLDALSGESLAAPDPGSLAAIARVVAGAGPAADLVRIEFSPGAMGALEASLAAHALCIGGWSDDAQAVLRRLELDGDAVDAVGMQATAGLLALDAGRPIAALEVLGDAVAPPAGRSASDVLRLFALARARLYCGRLDDADVALRDAEAVIDRLCLVVHEPEADLVGGLIMHARGKEEGVELLARSALRRPDRALPELVVATLDRRAGPQTGWVAQLRTLLESADRRVSLSARRALAALRDDAEELTSVAKQYTEAGLELEAALTYGVMVSTVLRVAPEEGRRLRDGAAPRVGSGVASRGVVYPGSVWWHDAGQQHTVRNKLSPAELRVAVAVGTGATNKEVSAHLFISVKTVDYHLQNIYRKLGARSRTELAVLLAGSAPERGSGA